MLMMKVLRQWVSNLKHYQRVEGDPPPDDWRTYMENHTAALNAPRCLNNVGLQLFKFRGILVVLLLLCAVPLYMLASTNVIFSPQLDWKCVIESHTGRTTICMLYLKRSFQKHAVCSMELGIDFTWNSSFTSSPILEFDSFCPLQRTVEPKLVNFLGAFCGSLVGGIFIDTLGRKNMSLSCTFFCVLCTFSYYFSSNMIMYTYQEFIKGVFGSIGSMSLLCWSLELSRPRWASFTVTSFFVAKALGELLMTGFTAMVLEWRTVFLILSAAGMGLVPLMYVLPPSLRYMIARGKTKKLPNNINFNDGAITGSRAKDCLSRPQTNRLYVINAIMLILLGFSSHLLVEVINSQHRQYDVFGRASIMQVVILAGHVIALLVALLPMLMYILNIFTVLIAGILAIVATCSTNDSNWSLARVFTGSSLMLVAVSISLTFTTMKQIPTLNRGFYVSGLNASYMLGSLVCVILQSWCLERTNETHGFCLSDSEDLKLITVGVVLLSSVLLTTLNTCLSKNVNMPHSYRELKLLTEIRSEQREEELGAMCHPEEKEEKKAKEETIPEEVEEEAVLLEEVTDSVLEEETFGSTRQTEL